MSGKITTRGRRVTDARMRMRWHSETELFVGSYPKSDEPVVQVRIMVVPGYEQQAEEIRQAVLAKKMELRERAA